MVARATIFGIGEPPSRGYTALMDQTGFAARLSRHLGRPVDAACAVRPPGTTIAIALCAGAGAGLGAVAGGSAIFAGIGGGLGALVGYLIVRLRTRGGDRAVAMALVLEDDHVELLRLGPLGTKPVGTLRSIPYADIKGVAADDRLLEVRLVLQTADGQIELDGGRRGVGAAPPVVEELKRRVARDTAAR
jgi:hypothetical protein